jgi:hypothetical protein
MKKQKIIDIYKEDVLEALYTEPLQFGTWWSIGEGRYNGENILNPHCRVCTIGSIFRCTDIPFYNVDIIEDQLEGSCTPSVLYNTKLPQNWITALSFVWESLNQHTIPVEEAREHMIDWVEDNVPDDEILFTIDPNDTKYIDLEYVYEA